MKAIVSILIIVCFGLVGATIQTAPKEIIVVEVHSVNNLGEQIQKEIQKKQSEGYDFREF